jgi:hypothetical protein
MRNPGLIVLGLFCCACERSTEVITAPSAAKASVTNVSDAGCWMLKVDGAEPRSAVIELRMVDGKPAPAVHGLPAVHSSPINADVRLQGQWRYGFTTDSMYLGLGTSSGGYALWLAREKGAEPPRWFGGVRVRADSVRAWTTTASLTRSPCRD